MTEFYTGPIVGDFLRAVERGEVQPLRYLDDREAPPGCFGFYFPENPGIVETFVGRFRASDGSLLSQEEAEDYEE